MTRKYDLNDDHYLVMIEDNRRYFFAQSTYQRPWESKPTIIWRPTPEAATIYTEETAHETASRFQGKAAVVLADEVRRAALT